MEDATKYCTHCGQKILEKAVICTHCGIQVQNLNITYFSQKNRIIAALLALFIGAFGVHWFYLDKNKYGVISIIFFWTFIPLIISVLYGAKLLLMSDYDFELIYGRKFISE